MYQMSFLSKYCDIIFSNHGQILKFFFLLIAEFFFLPKNPQKIPPNDPFSREGNGCSILFYDTKKPM